MSKGKFYKSLKVLNATFACCLNSHACTVAKNYGSKQLVHAALLFCAWTIYITNVRNPKLCIWQKFPLASGICKLWFQLSGILNIDSNGLLLLKCRTWGSVFKLGFKIFRNIKQDS